jgi:hypothetical protein
MVIKLVFRKKSATAKGRSRVGPVYNDAYSSKRKKDHILLFLKNKTVRQNLPENH